MVDFHGMIFAYNPAPDLGELVKTRTSASLPFCGRYRLIDFALSSLRNAGVRDVGVIMQRDYQSLLDHLGSGKSWDMSRKSGGLSLLPPFALPGIHTGRYSGAMEALNAVSRYVEEIPQNHVILMLGSACANIDLAAAMEHHLQSGAGVTAVCSDTEPGHRFSYLPDDDGFASAITYDCGGSGPTSLECYIIEKSLLLEWMTYCRNHGLYQLHRNAIAHHLEQGHRIGLYRHEGYARIICSTQGYYQANMDMLQPELLKSLFPARRPVLTHLTSEVSTYYGDSSRALRCLVADNCIIEGSIENCVISAGARIARGAVVKNSILMSGCTVAPGVTLDCVIADKNCSFSVGLHLSGHRSFPVVVPKGSRV